MCGIVGLFLKDKALEPKLGELLSEMLVSLSDRGPDSAGIAIYGSGEKKKSKITIQSSDPDSDFAGLGKALEKSLGVKVEVIVKSTHAVIEVPTAKLEAARDAGQKLEIKVLGLASIANDVSPELAREAIGSLVVLGALQASAAVKAALADRIL